MYTVMFEREEHVVARFYTHASNEANAESKCRAFFRNHPEEDFGINNPGFTTRVQKPAGRNR
jgi:hypothetical protein